MRNGCVGAIQAYPPILQRRFFIIKTGERHVGNGSIGQAAGKVDNTHRAFGIEGVEIVGFALVGGQHFAAIVGESDHVRQRAYHNFRLKNAIGIKKHHGAGHGLIFCFNGYRYQAIINGYAVDATAISRHIYVADLCGHSGVADVEDGHGIRIGIGKEDACRGGVKSGDFRRGCIEDVGLISRQQFWVNHFLCLRNRHDRAQQKSQSNRFGQMHT